MEVYNDIDGELVNLFEVIRSNSQAFLKRAEFLLYSRELYERWTQDLKHNRVPKDRVERALRFWYCMRSAYGGHAYKGWGFIRNDKRNKAHSLWSNLEQIQPIHERLRGVEIDHLDFRRLIKNRDAPENFFFLDPPYLEKSEYRLNTFTLKDHQDLATTLKTVKAKWLMTIGDHPEIRKLYPGLVHGTLTSSTAVEKITDGKRNTFRNLIVANYKIEGEVEDAS
jgi:DNA adenine methylase